jgi:hypothetical protein
MISTGLSTYDTPEAGQDGAGDAAGWAAAY